MEYGLLIVIIIICTVEYIEIARLKSQVKNLERASRYGIISGFLLNFRGTVHTYFLPIGDFISFASSTEKKSINENDVLALGALRIPSVKRKVYYDYDIGVLISYGKNKPVR